MNNNVLLAILEHKGIVTADEAEAIAEYLTNGIQASRYEDAKKAIGKLLDNK